METTNSSSKAAPSLFTQLVMMFATSALQHMGKLVNPMTQKTETNLEAAEATIDLLDMLQAKTKGNLEPDEEHMLKDTLTSLKLNFVELQKELASIPPASGKAADEEDKPGEDRDSDEKRKYHKSYD